MHGQQLRSQHTFYFSDMNVQNKAILQTNLQICKLHLSRVPKKRRGIFKNDSDNLVACVGMKARDFSAKARDPAHSALWIHHCRPRLSSKSKTTVNCGPKCNYSFFLLLLAWFFIIYFIIFIFFFILLNQINCYYLVINNN